MKSKKKIDKASLEVAAQNGISTTTVYRRVNQKGWSVEQAITTPTNPVLIEQRQKSQLYGMARGKCRAFRMPIEWEEQLDRVIDKSGLTENDFIAEAIAQHLGLQQEDFIPAWLSEDDR